MKTLRFLQIIQNTLVSLLLVILWFFFAVYMTSCGSESGRRKQEMIEKSLERQANSKHYEFVRHNPDMFTIENDSIATRRAGTSKIVYKLNKDDNRYYLCE